MEIVQANIEHLEEVQELVRYAIEDMIANGIYHWNEVYPPMDIFREDIEKGILYIALEREMIVGIVVLTHEMDPEYVDVEWEDRDGKPLVVHRLTVHPDHQRKGVASRLFEFSEEFGRKHGFTSLRLDTYSENPRSLALYSKRGYKRVPGEIFFPRENELPYYCFESVFDENETDNGMFGADPWLVDRRETDLRDKNDRDI